MVPMTGLLKWIFTASVVAVALCLIVNSASATPKKTIRDGKLTEAEYVDSSAKGKEGKVKIRHVPQLVVHPNVSVSTSRKHGK